MITVPLISSYPPDSCLEEVFLKIFLTFHYILMFCDRNGQQGWKGLDFTFTYISFSKGKHLIKLINVNFGGMKIVAESVLEKHAFCIVIATATSEPHCGLESAQV